jgi:O-antigen ligase
MTRSEIIGSPGTWLCAAAGLCLGAAAAPLAAMPARWLIAALAGLVAVLLVLASGRPRRAALFVFAFSLQIGLAVYLTDPPPASPVGASWPNSLALPLASLTAAGAFALRPGGPLLWDRGVTVSAALLGVTSAVSIIHSPARTAGLGQLLVLFAYFFTFLAAANTVHDSAGLDLVHRALVLSLGLQCLLYFAQALLGATFTPAGEWIEQTGSALGRYGGTVGTRPAAFSSFLLPLLLLVTAQFLGASAAGAALRSGALTLLGVAAMVLTFTRASWIGLALGLLYLTVAGARRGMWIRRNVVALLFILLLAVFALAPKILTRAAENHLLAAAERWSLVQMAWRVIQAHPFAGVGAGAYSYVFRDYLTPDLADRWLYVVHNVYVLRAAETGFPGLLALLVFLQAAFRLSCPERMADPLARRMSVAWRAGLVALSWEMLWDVSLGPSANSLLWFLCGVMAAAARLGRVKSA